MSFQSKTIKKTDDSAMALVHDIVGDKSNLVADIDSYYRIKDMYVFLEFVELQNAESIDDKWPEIMDNVSRLWEFYKKAGGSFWLIFYKSDRSVFMLNKLSDISETTFYTSVSHVWNFEEFKTWFQKLNAIVLK